MQKIVESLCSNVVQKKLTLIDLKYEPIRKTSTFSNDKLIKKRIIALENEIVSQKCLLTNTKKKLQQEESKLMSHEKPIHYLEQKRIQLQKSLKVDSNKVSLDRLSFVTKVAYI